MRTRKINFKPSVCGVGFIGNGEFKASVNGVKTDEYVCWLNMFVRCYSNSFHIKKPTYIGCLVHPDWHNFQTFARWYRDNHPGGVGYHLDKDKIVTGNKIYSAETCCFISAKENSEIAHAKEYVFKSPNGDVLKIRNLSDFCKKHDLYKSHMYAVASKKRKSHKGWRLA